MTESVKTVHTIMADKGGITTLLPQFRNCHVFKQITHFNNQIDIYMFFFLQVKLLDIDVSIL